MATCIGEVDGKRVGCRQDIKPIQVRKAVTLKDDNGKVTGMLHNKCYYVAIKQKRMGANGRHGEPPTAYEVALNRRTASDLTAEALETREKAQAAYDAMVARRADLAAQIEHATAKGHHSASMTLQELMDQIAVELEELETAKHLAEHQAELAAERAKEDDRSEFTDWRDPTEAEI